MLGLSASSFALGIGRHFVARWFRRVKRDTLERVDFWNVRGLRFGTREPAGIAKENFRRDHVLRFSCGHSLMVFIV